MLRRFRLDFADRQAEQAFKQGLEKRLLFFTCVACVIFCSCFTVALRECKDEFANGENQFEFAGNDLRTHRILIMFFVWLVIPGCFLLAVTLRLCLSWFQYVDWEMLAVVIPTIICGVLPWANRFTYAHLYGQDPYKVWARGIKESQAAAGLMLLSVFTGFCLFVPIRVHLLWMPVILGCLSCIVAAVWTGQAFSNLWILFIVLGLALCALKGARNTEQLARHSWLAQKQVQTKSLELVQQCASTSRILERLCDCLVQLDESFGIIDLNPRFSALLFCSNAKLLNKTNFCDYIDSDQDRHIFESELQKSVAAAEPNATDAPTGMVHINLRDTWGRKFGVSVYHTVVYDLGGRCGHMLACIESQDREPPPNDTTLDSFEFPLDSPPGHSITHGIDTASEDTSDSSSNAATSTGASEIAAWINVSSSDLQILSCTTGFTQLRPIAAGTGLYPFLVGDADELRKWLEECVNIQANDNLESIAEMPTCTVQLQPILTVAMGYSAVVKPDFETPLPPSLEQQAEDSIEDCHLLRIVMSQLQYHRLKEKKRSAAGRKYNRNRSMLRLPLQL